MQLKVVGRPLDRVEGPDKVSGKTLYTADVRLPGLLWGKCLRSPYPHARIARINTDKAKRVPGVRAVLTGRDLPPVRVGLSLRDIPVLALGRARFAGEKVSAVAAEDPDGAEEALSLIEVEYEELPALFDPKKAMEPGAAPIHEELASYRGFHPLAEAIPNVFALQAWTAGDLGAGLREADLILEHTFRTQLAHQAYLEPHAVIVAVDGAGRVEIWSSCKAPFRLKEQFARQLEVPKERVRARIVAVGGDFGGKGSLMDLPVCYHLARSAGRPVKMIMSYAEELSAGDPRHPSVVRLRTGVKKDGTLVAREAEVIFNSGAYAAFKPGEIPNLGGATHAAGVYRIPNYSIRSYGVYTNSVPCGYYRAPGQPQVVFAVESHMDLIARELGIDPLELRLKNLLRDGDKLPGGRSVDKVRCRETLEAAAKKIGWKKSKGGRGRGIAVSFRHVGAGGEANVELSASLDGGVTVLTAVPDTGTGTHTLLRQIAAEMLTIPPGEVRIAIGDTETFENDAAPGGSKITNMTGQALVAAAEEMCARMKSVAAPLLGSSAGEVRLERGRFFARRGKKALSFAEVVGHAAKAGSELRVRKNYKVTARSPVAAFVAQAAEVEADMETGVLRVRRLVTAHDVGTIINPVTHQGQVEGGAIQGFGYAVMEEIKTEEGRVVTQNLGDFRIPCIRDIPELETVLVEDPVGSGPFAAKQIGENAILTTAPAIANALDDAVGARLFDLPLTAEKVYFALDGARRKA